MAFREAAADAPYWYTVDWSPPSSIDQVANGGAAVVVGRIASARVGDPRPDDLEPYDGAPTLFWLDVVVDVEVVRVVAGAEDREVVQARIPVLGSGLEGLDSALPAAERIVTASPTGAIGVFVMDADGTARPVALSTSTGDLLGFYASMDRAVGPLTIDDLADEAGAAIS